MRPLPLLCLTLLLLLSGCAHRAAFAAVRHPTLLERWNSGGIALDVLHDPGTDVRWFRVVGREDGAAGAGFSPSALARINRGLDKAARAIVLATRRHPQDPGASAFFPGFLSPRCLLFEIVEVGHGLGERSGMRLLGFDGSSGRRLDLADPAAALRLVRASLPPEELPAFDRFAADWNRPRAPRS